MERITKERERGKKRKIKRKRDINEYILNKRDWEGKDQAETKNIPKRRERRVWFQSGLFIHPRRKKTKKKEEKNLKKKRVAGKQ